MSLRVQLFAVGLLALAIPWAGYRYVQGLEGTLRNGLEQSMLASANTMAAALELQPLPSTDSANSFNDTVYATPLNNAPDLDGYINDWGATTDTGRPIGAATEYWAGLLQRTVYLFISVTDEELL